MRYNIGMESPRISVKAIIILAVEDNLPGELHFPDILKVHASKLGDGDMFTILTAIKSLLPHTIVSVEKKDTMFTVVG